MAGKIVVPQEKTKKPSEEKIFPVRLIWIELLCLLIGGVALVLFFWGRSLFDYKETIDNELWGQFGDFIGGIVGTIISYISIRLLVRNLREQMTANKQQADNNTHNSKVFELQQFNEMFKLLFSQYQDTISNYKHPNAANGREAMTIITNEIKLHGLNIREKAFPDREKHALSIFDGYYVNYHDVAPVHFRILYRIFQLIDEAEIDEKQRRDVAKIMRCQLSEEELFLIRYNCKSPYGSKMRLYVNRYNLQKHLPILSLLEFSPYRYMLADEKQRNRLNTELSVIRKTVRDLFLKQGVETKVFNKEYSSRYRIDLEVTADNKLFRIILTKDENKPISQVDTDLDIVFEVLGHDMIIHLLYDLVCEIFVYSNFSHYNEIEDLKIEHDSQRQEQAKIVKYYVNVTKEKAGLQYPLICAQKQLDTPVNEK